jgi:hypothetical protein
MNPLNDKELLEYMQTDEFKEDLKKFFLDNKEAVIEALKSPHPLEHLGELGGPAIFKFKK